MKPSNQREQRKDFPAQSRARLHSSKLDIHPPFAEYVAAFESETCFTAGGRL